MKKLRSVTAIFIALVCLSYLPTAQAQESKKDKKAKKSRELKELLEGKRFTFRAQQAYPMGGGTWQLTSQYDFTVKGDSAICFLPYFGRAFTAPINPSEGGVKFTSTKFDYQLKARRKGGWEIQLKPRDVANIQFISMSITESGYGSLQVTDNTRQPIRFDGIVENPDSP